MHTLTCTSTFGNFKWTAKVDVTEDQAVELANAGLLQIIQRSPASKAEKSMANDGKGYEKRPEGFVRSSILFSDDNAVTLSKFLSEAITLGEDDSKTVITPTVTAVFHEIGKVAEPKFAQEKVIVQRHIDAKDIVTWNDKAVKFTGEGELDVENVEFLKAVKALKDRILAEQM